MGGVSYFLLSVGLVLCTNGMGAVGEKQSIHHVFNGNLVYESVSMLDTGTELNLLNAGILPTTLEHLIGRHALATRSPFMTLKNKQQHRAQRKSHL
jgi:hypothetical protein